MNVHVPPVGQQLSWSKVRWSALTVLHIRPLFLSSCSTSPNTTFRATIFQEIWFAILPMLSGFHGSLAFSSVPWRLEQLVHSASSFSVFFKNEQSKKSTNKVGYRRRRHWCFYIYSGSVYSARACWPLHWNQRFPTPLFPGKKTRFFKIFYLAFRKALSELLVSLLCIGPLSFYLCVNFHLLNSHLKSLRVSFRYGGAMSFTVIQGRKYGSFSLLQGSFFLFQLVCGFRH